MPNITEEKWIEMLEKKADGTYMVKYPKVKSKSGITFDEHLAENASQHGDLTTLKTSQKSSLVEAINELFTNVSDGKQLVGRAITDVDNSIVIPTDPTFNDLASAIGQISTGRKWASGNMMIPSNFVVSVTGLSFKPSIIFVEYDFFSTDGGPTVFRRNRLVYLFDTSDLRMNNVHSNVRPDDGTVSGSRYSPGWSVLSNGFSVSVPDKNLLRIKDANWIAIE